MLRSIFLLICLITCSLTQGAHNTPAQYSAEELQKIPTQQLIKESLSYIGIDSMAQRMLAGCNIIYNRYLDHPQDKTTRHAAVEALQAMGNHYMCREIDYRKAYKYLWLAKQIADEDQDYHSLATIYNSLANLYYFSSDNDDEKESTAARLISEATQAAIKSGNEKVLAFITVNTAIASASNAQWGEYAQIIPTLLSYHYQKDVTLGNQAQSMLMAVKYLIYKNYTLAENTLLSLQNPSSKAELSKRMQYTVDLLLIKVYHKSNQLPKAITLIRTMLKDVEQNKALDYKVTLYEQIVDIYNQIGQTDSSEYYKHKLRDLKESMEDNNGYKAVRELDFVTEIERINTEVEQLSIKRQEERRVRIIVISCCIILTILLLSLLWMYLNLKRTHRRLYRQSEEQMLREEQHRLMREHSKLDSGEASSTPESTPADISSDSDTCITDASSECPSSTRDISSDQESVSSDIDPVQMELMRRVYSRILIVMEENRQVFDNNFSIGDLATLVKETPRTVSRAINICHKTNFHTLLNEYRIREVIRLMHTPEASRHTIESLAEQAGFKSRTSFSSLFKRSTGLTPSEYLRMSAKKHDH